MKVLSIKEPYASLIKLGIKHYETRSYKTNYRGNIYIHASLGKDKCNKKLWDIVGSGCNGNIICRCKLVDCVYIDDEFINELKNNNMLEYECGLYKKGRYAWVLKNLEVIDNIPIKGNLGLWNYYSLDEVYSFLNSIKYGYMDNKGIVKYNFDTFKDDYCLQSKKEILKNKVGVCYDQVELERSYLYNRDISTYFICYYNDDCATHTFLVVHEFNKYYWFEHAWEKYKGIHEFNSLEELISFVKDLFIRDYKVSNIDRLVLKEYSKPKSGISLSEYFKWVEKNF